MSEVSSETGAPNWVHFLDKGQTQLRAVALCVLHGQGASHLIFVSPASCPHGLCNLRAHWAVMGFSFKYQGPQVWLYQDWLEDKSQATSSEDGAAGRQEGNGSNQADSCLENPRDGGAWWAAVYGVAQSRTRPKRLSSSSSRLIQRSSQQSTEAQEKGVSEKQLRAGAPLLPPGQRPCWAPQPLQPALCPLTSHANVLVQKNINRKVWPGCLRALRQINPQKERARNLWLDNLTRITLLQ